MPADMDLVDIGVNLAHDSFDADREAVLRRARDAGVGTLIVTGSSRASSFAALELARTQPGRLFSTAGIHPHHAADFGRSDTDWMRELASAAEVVAIGECGLDFFRDFSPRPDQERAFHQQLEVAEATRMPVFLHQRDAHNRFCAILDEHLDGLSGGGVAQGDVRPQVGAGAELGRARSCWPLVPRSLTNRPRTRRLPVLAPVAQLDRASDFGSEGWGFESLRAR